MKNEYLFIEGKLTPEGFCKRHRLTLKRYKILSKIDDIWICPENSIILISGNFRFYKKYDRDKLIEQGKIRKLTILPFLELSTGRPMGIKRKDT